MKADTIRLGILGGLGPMSTFYFCEMLTSHTAAQRDADHIDMIISSRATTPDRTAFILGKSKQNPLPVMLEEANRLANAGADLLVIPCNTAHYFYDGLQKEIKIPILNIITETVNHLHQSGVSKFGLLATEGTVASGAYHAIAAPMGIECAPPAAEEQQILSSIIFDRIKQNKPVDLTKFLNIAARMKREGCEKLVLGCTELSLLKKQGLEDDFFVDSLEVLAYRTILTCGKKAIDFPSAFYPKQETPT